jgi:hypothetical protein
MMMMMMMMMVLFCLSKRTPLLNGLGFNSRYANSLRQNATITPQHPSHTQTYNPPPRPKTLDCFFAKPAPEVVAAANSPAIVSTPARNFSSGPAAARTRVRT